MTLGEAKALRPGDTLYSVIFENADGSPQRWRVNGRPLTWKRRPNMVTVPLKRGLNQHHKLTENYLAMFELTLERAIAARTALRLTGNSTTIIV